MSSEDPNAVIPTRLEAWFKTGAGPEERLTFPVWPNKGSVVKFERTALDQGVALSTPTDASWSALRRACELVGAFSWDSIYGLEAGHTDLAEWSVEIDWPDRSVRSMGRGAFPRLTPDAPPLAALDHLCSALSRLVDGREIFGRAAYRRPRMPDAVTDASIREAIRRAAARLGKDDRLLEVRLDSALAEGIHRVADVECTEGRLPLPGWVNPRSDTREVDLLVAGLGFEQKVEDIDQQIWDAVKLLSMLRGGSIRGAYLVGWAASTTFDRSPASVLYRPAGLWEVSDLIARMSASWRKCLEAGNNAPLQTPARVRTVQAARVDCRDGREIRAVRLELVDDEDIGWVDGVPQQRESLDQRDVTLTIDDLIDAWSAQLAKDATWWHRARHEAYTAVAGLDLRAAPAAANGAPPRWFDPTCSEWGARRSEAFASDGADGTLHWLLEDAGKRLAPAETPFSGYLEASAEIEIFWRRFGPDLRANEAVRVDTLRQMIKDLIEVIYGPHETFATTSAELRFHGFDPRVREPELEW